AAGRSAVAGRIRSHAMKGKNAGRVIPGRGRKKQLEQCQRLKAAQVAQASEGVMTAKPVLSISEFETHKQMFPNLLVPATAATAATWPDLPLNPFAGAEWSCFSLPEPLTRSSRYLCYQFHNAVCDEIYPRIFCRPTKEALSYTWFERFIVEPCFFHCGLGMTASYLSLIRGHPGDETLEAARHFTQAMRLLYHDLAINTVPRDSSVGVVISLAIHANLTGAVRESRIHFDGLQKMLDLRPGGLAALRVQNRELCNKIRRADMELALLTGTTTTFGQLQLQLQPAPPLCLLLSPQGQYGINLPCPFDQTHPVLQHAALDILALCNTAGQQLLDAYQYQDVVISIVQRLLDFAPLGSKRAQLAALDDVCQLGLLAFMTTVIYPHGRVLSIYSALLSRLLRERLNEDDTVQLQSPPLCLWLVFVYAFMTRDEQQQQKDEERLRFVAHQICALARTLRLGTWEEARAQILDQFPWVAALHDAPGKELW
ncbi:hypothetical protein QBC46DRAFT_236982, partial [Diplogelasinospora grovesii]